MTFLWISILIVAGIAAIVVCGSMHAIACNPVVLPLGRKLLYTAAGCVIAAYCSLVFVAVKLNHAEEHRAGAPNPIRNLEIQTQNARPQAEPLKLESKQHIEYVRQATNK